MNKTCAAKVDAMSARSNQLEASLTTTTNTARLLEVVMWVERGARVEAFSRGI